MTTQNGHVHDDAAPAILPPATPEDSALAQLQMLLAGGATVDPHQLLGQKEARLTVVTQALAAAIEELKKWSALGLPYEVVKKLADDHKNKLKDVAAAEAVAEAHAPVVLPDLAHAQGPAETSETIQKSKGK